MEGFQKQIESSIQNFNKKHHIESEKNVLSSEDLKAILLYILVQSNQTVFFVHLQIGQSFNLAEGNQHQQIIDILTSCF